VPARRSRSSGTAGRRCELRGWQGPGAAGGAGPTALPPHGASSRLPVTPQRGETQTCRVKLLRWHSRSGARACAVAGLGPAPDGSREARGGSPGLLKLCCDNIKKKHFQKTCYVELVAAQHLDVIQHLSVGC